jgi:hypothetical protein
MYFSLGYAPFVPFGGYLFEDFTGFHPLGLTLRAGYLLLPVGTARFGMELAPGFALLGSSTDGVDDGAVFHIGLNLAAQFTLRPQRVFINARFGAAIMIMDGYAQPVSGVNTINPNWPARAEPRAVWCPGLTLGVGATWLFTEHLFAEAGLEFTFAFDREGAFTYLRPALSVGYRYSKRVSQIPQPESP